MTALPKVSETTQVEINRLRFIEALRTWKGKQGHGSFFWPRDSACALAIAIILFTGERFATVGNLATIMRILNINAAIKALIINDNDIVGLSLNEIADAAEAGRYW